MPSRGRFPSSQYIHIGNWHGLIDCGEGTQIQLSNYRIRRNKISHIFISHLHGDHVFGLPGLLGSYNHFNRIKPLTIYGPPGLNKLINTIIDVSGAHYSYTLNIVELEWTVPGTFSINDNLKIQYFPLKHRVPTIGYRFDLNEDKINIIKESLNDLNLSIQEIRMIKKGKDVILNDGKLLKWDSVARRSKVRKSYAYCSDTIYDEDIISFIEHVDYLYHETTYLDGMESEASYRKHSTLGQAIKITQLAKAKNLITGHYSSRYKNLDDFIKVSESNEKLSLIIGREGMRINL